MHTSTVVVAVLTDLPATPELDEADLAVEWFSGTGKGGQHRNKHQNSCRVRHLPTGLVEARQGRKRETNLREAKAALAARLADAARTEAEAARAADKRRQIGSGMRADKTVTIRLQDNRATHHGTGRSMRADLYMKGQMDALWS